jgi:hypothetical protein
MKEVSASAEMYWKVIDEDLVTLLANVIEAKAETQGKLDEATKAIIEKSKGAETDDIDPLLNHRKWVEVMEGLIIDIRESRHTLDEAKAFAEAITPKTPKSVKAGFGVLVLLAAGMVYAIAQKVVI